MQLPVQNQPRGDGDVQPSDDVQDDWEDLSDGDEEPPREIVIPNMNDFRTASLLSLRKVRRGPIKTSYPASPTPSKFQSIRAHRKTPIVKKEEIEKALTHGVRYTTSFGFHVLKDAIDKMRKPLSWCLFLFMLAHLVSYMTTTFRTAFAPLCIIPGISRTMLCVPITPPPNFDKLVNIQSSTFEQLVGESAGGSQLSVEVLRAEMATQDLSLLVRYSDLKSKDSIADMLDTIGTDAKKTGRGLSRLDAQVVGAIDEVMALNNYAMATIQGADKKAHSPLLQAISPFKLGPTAEEIITEAFTLAMSESELAVRKLILEAEVSWKNLEQLDADVGVLHEIITREDKYTTVERDRLLGELWTKLGGNKKAVRDYGDRLALLNNLGEYRKQAVAHVKAALRALHTMSDDLEVLRERVAAPGLLESKVPLHVHMESIQNGLERLQEGRRASRGRGIADETVKMLLNGGRE